MKNQANIQYIYNTLGEKTAVVVPITVWESLIHNNEEKLPDSKRKRIESLFGILKNSPILDEIEEYSRITRETALERI